MYYHFEDDGGGNGSCLVSVPSTCTDITTTLGWTLDYAAVGGICPYDLYASVINFLYPLPGAPAPSIFPFVYAPSPPPPTPTSSHTPSETPDSPSSPLYFNTPDGVAHVDGAGNVHIPINPGVIDNIG